MVPRVIIAVQLVGNCQNWQLEIDARGGGGFTEPNFGRGRAILVKIFDP